MKVKLLHNTPLYVADTAVGKCWNTGCKDTPEARDERLLRVINKHKHGSIAEHLTYSFDIDGISRGCLQELARHRHASISVKSTRYTLKEIKDCSSDKLSEFLVPSGDTFIDGSNILQLDSVRIAIAQGVSNDVVKYGLPEAFKTSLVWTINARSLQNFLQLRTSRSALKEIRVLAEKIYEALPTNHKYLFKEFINYG